MKKFIIAILMWLSTAVTIVPQTLVWEKQIGNKAIPMCKSIVTDNGLTIIFVNSSTNTKLMALNKNEILWQKEINGFFYDICKNPNGFCATILDSVRVYNENGDIIYSHKVPTSTAQENILHLAQWPNGYIVVDGGSHPETKIAAIYDNNYNLINAWPTQNLRAEDISISNEKILIAAWQYGGGAITNVHSEISAYDFSGNRLWNDSIPDAIRPRVTSFNGNVYMAATFYDKAEGFTGTRDGWLIKKYLSDGQIQWSNNWDGDNNYKGGNWVHDIEAIPIENAGCIISGATTRQNAPIGDPNEYQGTIKAFDSNGIGSWKIINDNPAYYWSFFASICWDKSNSLLGVHCKVSRAFTTCVNNLVNYFIPGVTPVESEVANGVPSNFTLHQNYPNPFNPSTTISFTLSTRVHVSLKIYDALGKEVTELVNEELNAGTYEKIWSAENLVSGEYFYRLKCGNFISTKKMIFLK